MVAPTPIPSARRASRRPARVALAVRAGLMTSAVSRRLGRGDGTVIGGRVSLLVDPRALAHLGAGRWTALVSGTNGKTTTTRLLRAALATAGPVATNPQGSNLPPGLVAGLSAARAGAAAALEVDEAWLGIAADALQPRTLTLLNLTRDQLDRVAEVRRLSERWRMVVRATPGAHVIANADDPLVAWAALAATGAAPSAGTGAPLSATVRATGAAGPLSPQAETEAPDDAGLPSRCTWVGAGQPWLEDASGCPSCGGRIRWHGPDWACGDCGFCRPEPALWLEGDEVVEAGGRRHQLALALPGRANRANAAMAAATAACAGVTLDTAFAAMAATTAVDGRYRQAVVGDTRARMLLAKNPAGWLEVFDMLAPPPGPVVVVINARIADGRDPSWLWDVPFERLAGRRVAASGERCLDLAVRLHYAGVEHLRIADPLEAVRALGPAPVDVAANYTALRDIDGRLGRQLADA